MSCRSHYILCIRGILIGEMEFLPLEENNNGTGEDKAANGSRLGTLKREEMNEP
jgi:hypothetical protein